MFHSGTLSFHLKIRLCWKGSKGSNALAYLLSASETTGKKFYDLRMQENPFETGQTELRCLNGYDSQRTSGDEDIQHSDSFDARDQVQTVFENWDE